MDDNDTRRPIRLDDVRALHRFFRERRSDVAPARADAGIYFQNQLEFVIQQAYEHKLVELKMANGQVIPIRSSIPRGAKTWSYEMFEPVGFAKFLTTASWRDIPRADVTGSKTIGHVAEFGVGYGYTLGEIEESQFANKPLTAMKATATRRAWDQLLNTTGITGSTERNLQGFTNHPNITVADAAIGAAGSGSFSWTRTTDPKTGLEMIEDLNDGIDTMLDLTGGVERPTHIALSRAYMRRLQTTRVGTDLSTTALKIFREDNPEIQEMIVLEDLDTASTGGAHAAMFWRQDPQALWLEVPIGFEQHGPQQDGLEFGVMTRGSTAGVICVYPLSVLRMDFDGDA
jgi:hypothetical protein